MRLQVNDSIISSLNSRNVKEKSKPILESESHLCMCANFVVVIYVLCVMRVSFYEVSSSESGTKCCCRMFEYRPKRYTYRICDGLMVTGECVSFLPTLRDTS